jgi:hypothetical protein
MAPGVAKKPPRLVIRGKMAYTDGYDDVRQLMRIVASPYASARLAETPILPT